jgi:hypothetical protein
MGSWVRCKCGQLVHKNLFCGTGVSIIATEEFLDADRPDLSARDFISELISSSAMLLKCPSCGRLIVLRETGDATDAEFYAPESP